MNVSHIHDVKDWFTVMQTAQYSQTAVMVLSSGDQSSGDLSTHEKSDQVLFLVEGELLAVVGGERKSMRKGDACMIPAGTPHRFENLGKDRAVTFNVYSPPEYAPDERG
jgi:mannose-6-phosphate isomerase-like protein (cupin superfamily)